MLHVQDRWETMKHGRQFVEALLGYHPCVMDQVTQHHESGGETVSGGQFDWGGRLPKSNGGAQRFPQNGWKSFEECKGRRELDCETTSRAGTKVGLSAWKGHRSTDKSYLGDNRLISPKSPHRRGGLAPRCRLVTSWG